jgi:predicted small metal-binding protein
MKTFACGAVVPGCTASFTAETEEGILEQVARHAGEDHDLPEVPRGTGPPGSGEPPLT